jgi:two-component system LytT family response regulator
MIRAVIVDADPESRRLIHKAVEAYCPNVTLLAAVENVKAGVAAINEHEPELVLLEVKLPDGSGFDLIKHFSKPEFKVIFITDYLEYAIKGYKYSAIDFIPKPFDPEELARAVNRADDLIRYEEKLRFKALADNFKAEDRQSKLILRTSDHVHLVALDEIIRIEADGNYSSIFMKDGRKILMSRAIGDYEAELIDKGFFRVHKSFIININKMIGFSKAEGGDVILDDGSRVPVASRKRNSLLALFDSLV